MVAVARDKIVKLRELPVEVNVTKLAGGFLDLFTEDERVVLRFGMLPAQKMELLVKELTAKFCDLGKPWGDDKDILSSTVNGQCVDWSLKALVTEAVHEISLGLYAIGDLVV